MCAAATSDEAAILVIVADESRADIYTRKGRQAALDRILTLTNESGRLKARDLVTDRGGRAFDSFGKGRHAMGREKSNPKKHAAAVFAKQIAEHIQKAVHDGSCREYALVAAPRFLGELRDAVARVTKAEPYATVAREMVGRDEAAIAKLLENP